MAETEGQVCSDRVVFDDRLSRRARTMTKFVWLAIVALFIATLLFSSESDSLARNPAYWGALLAGMLGFALLDRIWFKPRLVIDADGLGGRAMFKSCDERLPWSKFKSIEVDQQAVVLEFEPADTQSADPAERRSKKQIAFSHYKPEEIAAAIEKFWKAGERASGA